MLTSIVKLPLEHQQAAIRSAGLDAFCTARGSLDESTQWASCWLVGATWMDAGSCWVSPMTTYPWAPYWPCQLPCVAVSCVVKLACTAGRGVAVAVGAGVAVGVAVAAVAPAPACALLPEEDGRPRRPKAATVPTSTRTMPMAAVSSSKSLRLICLPARPALCDIGASRTGALIGAPKRDELTVGASGSESCSQRSCRAGSRRVGVSSAARMPWPASCSGCGSSGQTPRGTVAGG